MGEMVRVEIDGIVRRRGQYQPPPTPHLYHPNFRSRRRGESGRRSASRLSFLRGIKELREVEALYKSERVRESVCDR